MNGFHQHYAQGHIHSYQGFTTTDLDPFYLQSGCTMENNFMPRPRLNFSTAEARQIGGALGIDWRKSPFNVEQFRMGLDVELEHGRKDLTTNVTDDDPITTGKIALAHLNEFPDYYTRLTRLEKEAKAFWKK